MQTLSINTLQNVYERLNNSNKIIINPTIKRKILKTKRKRFFKTFRKSNVYSQYFNKKLPEIIFPLDISFCRGTSMFNKLLEELF